MTRRKKWPFIVIAIVVVIVGGSLIWWESRGPAQDAASQPAGDDSDTAVATVQLATIRAGQIEQTLTAYGSAVAAPNATTIYSLDTDVRVVHLRVTAGQAVKKGAPLADVQPTPDATLQLTEAQDALAAGKKDLADAEQRFELKLATNSDLLAAQQSARSAQVKLDDLLRRGVGAGPKTIEARSDSLVVKIDAQEGQIAQASAPIVELIPDLGMEIRLGIEPADSASLRPGQPVKLFADAWGADGIAGTLRSVSRQIDPDTRLADAYITPAPGLPMLIDLFVRGQLMLRSVPGLIVPRNAVLPDGDGFTLFTVKDGKAVKHTVAIAIQNDKESAITGDGISVGDQVVVQGNLELDDGVAVTTPEAK